MVGLARRVGSIEPLQMCVRVKHGVCEPKRENLLSCPRHSVLSRARGVVESVTYTIYYYNYIFSKQWL